MAKPCKKCDEDFHPNSRYSRVCLECLSKLRQISKFKVKIWALNKKESDPEQIKDLRLKVNKLERSMINHG